MIAGSIVVLLDTSEQEGKLVNIPYLGIWFPDVKYGWYEKDPDKVTNEEFDKLVISTKNFHPTVRSGLTELIYTMRIFKA
jgi:hypothetical protein